MTQFAPGKAVIASFTIILLSLFGVSCEEEPTKDKKLFISGFAPQEGGEGDLVVITGKNFPEQSGRFEVRFGDYWGAIESATSDELLVRLPPYIYECNEVTITVVKDTTKFTFEGKFKLACPKIESFTPARGDIGDTITINGKYFTDNPSRIKVTIGTGYTEVLASSASMINVKLLAGYSGYHPVKVEIGDKVAVSSSSFRINGPVITDFFPSAANTCESITITGSDFSPVPGENNVLFGHKEGVVVSASANQLIVTAPVSIKEIAGMPIHISVTINGKQAISAGTITLTESWQKAASLGNTGRWRAIGFSINEKGYAGTGLMIVGGFGELRKDFWQYDLASDTWTKKADLPGVTRLDAVGFSIGGKGYVGLGGDHQNELLNDFWQYDPANDSWQRMPDFPGEKRARAIAFSVGGMGYVGTGWGFGATDDIWKFDPENKVWTKETEYPGNGTTGMVCFAIGEKAYMGTGDLTNDFWEYTPATKQWRQLNNFPEPFIHHGVGLSFGDFGIAGTGGGDGGRTDHIWRYDPTQDEWSRLPDFGGAGRNFAIGFSVGNTFLIGTGSTSFNIDEVNDFFRYGCD